MEQTVSTQSDVNLDASLAAYGRRARRSQRNKMEILGYTAAAGGLAFAGGDAMGAIVHNTTSQGASVTWNTQGTTNQGTFLYVDIDGSGEPDWGVLLGFFDGQDARIALNYGVDVVGTPGNQFKFALSLANGFVVGPTLASGTFLNYADAQSPLGLPMLFVSASVTGIYQAGSLLNTTAYMGLRFDGDTGTVGPQYAWVKVKVESSTTRIAVTLLEWAYDNSGCPIQVGATSGGGSCGGSENNNSVDSPSTPLLSLLGLGAMGVTSYRRRREAGLKRLAEAQGDVAA